MFFFPVFGYCRYSCCEYSDVCFYFLEQIPKSGLAEADDRFMFNF